MESALRTGCKRPAYLKESFEGAVSVDRMVCTLQSWEPFPIIVLEFFQLFQRELLKMWYGTEMGNGKSSVEEELASNNITNPYRDLIDQEHVYIVDNKIDLTLKYIKEYYQENVEAELVKESGNVKVYQIKSITEQEDS